MVRWIANWLLASMPAVFLVGVAMNGRAEPPQYSVEEFGSVGHAQILAYSEPMKMAARALSEPNAETRARAVVDTAHTWTALWESGKLKPVKNPRFESPYGETILGGINSTKIALVTEIEHLASKRSPDEAGALLALAIRLTQVSKYADLAVIHQASFRQNKMLVKIEGLSATMSRAARSRVAVELRAVLAEEPQIDECVRSVRESHTRQLASNGRQQSAARLARSYQALAEATLEPSLVASALTRQIARSIPRSEADGLANVITVTRLAKLSDEGARERAKALLEALSAKSVADDQRSGL